MTLESPALELLEELLQIASPSGREERMAQVIGQKLKSMGYAYEQDPAGNLIVRLPGANADLGSLMIAAHMDEIGMVVTRIEPDGSLIVDRSGGLYPAKIGECPVEIVGDKKTVPGIFSMGSMHRSDANDVSIKWKDVRIITGLSPESLAAAGVRPGSSAVPSAAMRGPVLLGEENDPLIAAWTFDDRMGVVTLLRLLEVMKLKNLIPHRPTLICFTVHEEGGCHGAKVLAHREKPEVFLAVDGCPMPEGTPLKLDGRPGIWSKDTLVHYDQRLIVELCQAAQRAGTELQPVVYESAASDASHVYSTGGAPRVAFVGHVRENSHGYEVARFSVMDNVLNTLVQFLKDWQ